LNITTAKHTVNNLGASSPGRCFSLTTYPTSHVLRLFFEVCVTLIFALLDFSEDVFFAGFFVSCFFSAGFLLAVVITGTDVVVEVVTTFAELALCVC
jgi:hypothetical protein